MQEFFNYCINIHFVFINAYVSGCTKCIECVGYVDTLCAINTLGTLNAMNAMNVTNAMNTPIHKYINTEIFAE